MSKEKLLEKAKQLSSYGSWEMLCYVQDVIGMNGVKPYTKTFEEYISENFPPEYYKNTKEKEEREHRKNKIKNIKEDIQRLEKELKELK